MAEPRECKVGEKVEYIETGELGTVQTVHRDDPAGAYYTLIMERTGKEKQTIRDSISCTLGKGKGRRTSGRQEEPAERATEESV